MSTLELNGSELDGQTTPEQGEILNQETEQPEISPGQEAQPEQSGNGVQQRINKLTADKYAEQRRADDLQAKLDAMESGQPQAKAPVAAAELQAPTLPDDLYDETAMQKYHQDMIAFNKQAAESSVKSVLEQQNQTQLQQQQEQQQQQAIQQYGQRGLDAGLTIEELQHADKVVGQSGISSEVATFLIQDEHGAQMVDYLAKNPAELHELAQMNPMQAAAKISTTLKTKALSVKPKVTQAPDPATQVNGGGQREIDPFDAAFPDAQIS
ncbi:hypothetical protein [Vibrio sp. SCSIO 43136]|uniref:hypothetical protein n=1 Tax=Vibrio sp. SCSIO 43136 TaxID=2819101 RepID=UPI002075ED12|nr:hypothetical protein [Vibrio sp. SCSIO 43136]USD64217.1 hypothetical protein J4N39_08845 [Vibrio sp. SCSIO 43136]